MVKYDLVIFDLDGTLLDTLKDLTVAANHALSVHGFPVRTSEQIRLAIGGGVRRLINLSLPDYVSDAVRSEILSDFRSYYSTHLSVHTRPYNGIAELLIALRTSGVHIAVNSNKVDDAVQFLCKTHFPGLIDLAFGERDGISRKPSPDGAFQIIDSLKSSLKRTLYVGDGDTDLKTANNAGIDSAWVSWGFRHIEEIAGIPYTHSFTTVESLRHFVLS